MSAQSNAAPTGSSEGNNGTATPTGSGQGSTTPTTSAPGASGQAEITSMLAGSGGEAGGKERKEGEGDKASGDASKVEAKDDASKAELEITLPDALKGQADEATLGEFKTKAKEAGLTGEAASKLATWWLERQAKEVERQDGLVQQQSATWLGEIKKDTEFGGAKLPETQAHVQRAFARFGDAETSKALTAMGIDNFPGLVRMFARVGRAIAEDKGRVPGNGPEQKGASSKEERLQSLYDKSSPRA